MEGDTWTLPSREADAESFQRRPPPLLIIFPFRFFQQSMYLELKLEARVALTNAVILAAQTAPTIFQTVISALCDTSLVAGFSFVKKTEARQRHPGQANAESLQCLPACN